MAKRRMMSGSSARDLIAPVNGHRGKLAAQGKSVKNHHMDNRRALKEMQRRNMAKAEVEKEQAGKGLSKMKQFQGVKSRVFESAQEANYLQEKGRDEDENDAPQKNFLKKKSGDYRASEQMAKLTLGRKHGDEAEPSPRVVEKRADVRKAPIPNSRGNLKPRINKDFKTANKSSIVGAKPTARRGQDDSPSKHESYGEVPGYLRERKKQWEEEERLRELNRPDADCPDGMVLMPEEERLETLQVLSQSEEEARQQLFAMPLTVETVAAMKKKNGLEAKLKEIEDAKKIFERPKVYISM